MLAIFLNLIPLIYYKYTNFIIEIINIFLKSDLKSIVQNDLPVGISFYTFMCISFIVETYRNNTKRVSLIKFSTYLSMFPHLVAGPILRYSEIRHAIDANYILSNPRFIEGSRRFVQGLAMKVLVADTLAPVADQIFSEKFINTDLNIIFAWIGAIIYTLQIFFDFAGYSAMAIGLGIFIGFNFPENFNKPYRADTLTEFWRRWHMTLTRWFRDYVYLPLGGNKSGVTRSYFNIGVVFLLSGIWHGASWNFILWGIYNGVLVISEKILKIETLKSFLILRKITTIIVIIYGWTIFRTDNLIQLQNYTKSLVDFKSIENFNLDKTLFIIPPNVLIITLICFIFCFYKIDMFSNKELYSRKHGKLFSQIIYTFIFTISIVVTLFRTYQPFIYFRF